VHDPVSHARVLTTGPRTWRAPRKLASYEQPAYAPEMSRSGLGLCRLAGAIVLAATGSSCGNLPGTTLGTYKVTGVLSANTCGSGLGAPDPWQFDVQLSEAGSTLYWNWMDASPLLSGPLNSPTTASLTGYEIANVDATDAAMGPCDMQRNDAVEVMLGTGTPPASFQGTIRYAFSAQEGTDCSDQLRAAGGMYGELPCSVSYSITASRQ
jgi:hypothetical protein